MTLIGYPSAGRASAFLASSIYHLVGAGLRIGIAQNCDITGNQGMGHGARVVYDALGSFSVGTSAGRGTSRLFKVTRKGRGQRAHDVRKLISKRAGARGAVLGARARATGTGDDQETVRQAELDQWLAGKVDPDHWQAVVARFHSVDCVVMLPHYDYNLASTRAALHASMQADQAIGKILLRIGARAGAKQAQRLSELRGVAASLTSIHEASSAAIAGILESVRRLDKVPGHLWHGCGLDHCSCSACAGHNRLVRVLRLYASRAAFKSLATWATVGITGDNSSATFAGRSFIDEFTAGIADTLGAEQWRATDQVWFESQSQARWRLARWIYAIGYRDFCATLTGKGAGMARKQARSRCRVVCSVIYGATIADSCARAGFESQAAWVRSCKGALLFQSLRDARRAQLLRLPSVQAARAAMRQAALQAASAIKSMGLQSGQWSDPCATVARSVKLASGASSVRYVACGYRVTHPASSRTIQAQGARGTGTGQAGFAWLQAVNAREQAIAKATWLRDQALDLVADNLRAFDKVLAGLHSERFGNLRQVFGFVDCNGRESSKRNPQSITRARGKVARKPILAPTVAIDCGARSLQCAPSVSSQSWAQGGESGFAIVKARS